MVLTTSPNLGPLTTYWTPPSTCISTMTSVNDWDENLWLGMTGNIVNLNCYPPNYATDDVYSPGICPSGWTSACSPQQASTTSAIFPPTITAVQCCPSSLSCYTSLDLEQYGFAFCTSSISASYISALAVPSPTSGATPKSGVISGSWVYGNFKNQAVRAKPIFVAYQSTDSEILQLLTPSLRSPSTTSASSTTPTSAPPTSTVTTGLTIHGGLSQGSKVAIGVTIPVVVLAIIVATLLYCIRRRRKSQMPTHSAHDGTGAWQAKAELPGESNWRPVAELEGPQPRGHSMR